MKKLAGLKRVLDGINQLNNGSTTQTDGPAANNEPEFNDKLKRDDFNLAKINRYGFPYHATCIALDPVQRLIAIGTISGAIRICGKPGVEFHIHHESNASVIILSFLINEGGLVSVCNDASLHIWSLRQNQPALIQSLNFKKERITAIHNPFGSKWLYVGTERGNIYMVHVETFRISGYVISWNHVIDVSCKSHPGPCTQINTNPQDQNKLLLNFESGVCVMWDLRSKKLLHSYSLSQASQYVTSASWHTEGKQFMTGHWDGSLSTWTVKDPKKPDETQMPHATGKTSGSKEKDASICCPVVKLEWLAGKAGEISLIIFSGGMPHGNKNKGLTIMRGRSKSLLLSDQVIDFQCLLSTPFTSDFPEPQALFVLLRNEIVVFDLLGQVAPRFDIHESPITCVQFFPECPNTLLTALHSLGKPQQRMEASQSTRQWPLYGGQEGEVSQDPAVIITGHVDGTVKFWDATSNMLILCHRISVARLFERHVSRQSSTTSNVSKASSVDHFEDPFAVQHIKFCQYGRVLTVACQSYFTAVFKFSTKEDILETTKIDVNFSVEVGQECNESPTSIDNSANDAFSDANYVTKPQQRLSNVSITPLYHPPFRNMGIKWPSGFQPTLVCQQVAAEPMPNITTVSLSSAYSLIAFGNALGVAVVDYVQKCTVMVLLSYELGVAGEWTDSSQTPNKLSVSSSRSNPLSPPPTTPTDAHSMSPLSDKKEKKDEKRKERLSRVVSGNLDSAHEKIFRKHSVNSMGSSNGLKDKEDGLVLGRERIGEPTAGSIHALSFAYCYTRKGGNMVCPSLWVGTSLGATAIIALSVPSGGEQRSLQPVLALCTGTLLDQRHCVLDITHLDKSGNICVQPFEFWRNNESANPNVKRMNIQTINTESTVRSFVVITTEKDITVKSMPSLKTLHVEHVAADSYIVKAESMNIDGGNCIGCLTTDGLFKVYSLPGLRPLLDVQCGVSLADYRMIRTFTMGKGGEAVFLASPTEIQRIAFTKQKEESFVQDHGCLFTMCPLPEPKAKGFFESFFTTTVSTLDRDELFGPNSGNVRKVADYVPGSGMESLRGQADSAAGAVNKAKMLLIERGEKLNTLQDRTEEMNARAHNFSSAAKALADKYQRKKWYQL